MDWLQAFLRENKVDFETQPAPEQLEAGQQARGEEDGEEGAVEPGDGEDAPAKEGINLRIRFWLQFLTPGGHHNSILGRLYNSFSVFIVCIIQGERQS